MALPLSLAAALALALVHLFAAHLRFLDAIPRSRWLSFGSGISVAYVFLHLLPELTERGEALAGVPGGLSAVVEHPAYLLALVGLAVFYGLERLAERSRRAHHARHGVDRTPRGVFWIHILSFGLYNAVIGYLLGHAERDRVELGLFFVAMALHFVVNDYGLRMHHKELYRRTGRWVLVAAVLAGWGAGVLRAVPEALLTGVLALLAGAVVLNVMKEELPEERESRFGAFALGAAAYAALLLAL